MNLDIRSHVIQNFKNVEKNEIKDTINESMAEKDEVILPGFGVFFELLWKHSSDDLKENVLTTIFNAIEKES